MISLYRVLYYDCYPIDKKAHNPITKKTIDFKQSKIEIADLTENDVEFELQQKGIDIKIGVDIAQLTLKKFVNIIILISRDSDFVPAAKLARREGLDFILDPMWNNINPDLFEHIDGLQIKMKRHVKC